MILEEAFRVHFIGGVPIFKDGSARLRLGFEDAVFGERLPLQGREE